MKNVRYHYFKLREAQSEHKLVFSSLSEFNQFVELQQIKTIFLLCNTAGEPEHFLVTHKGGMLQHSAEGYQKLEDYVAAQQNKFPDAATFYAAQQEGYSSYEDYQLILEAGINDKLIFDKVKEGGFITGLAEYSERLKNLHGTPDIGAIKNAYQLYEYAQQNGFKDFNEFKQAFTKGFSDADTYRVASGRGFANLADYKSAEEAGFLSAGDWEFARKHLLRDYADSLRYIDLQALHHAGPGHDQRLLLSLLSKLEQGKKVSINKLIEKFEAMQNEYRYTDTGEMPPWFVKEFDNKYTITEYLTQNEHVKKYGSYHNDGEYFEVNRLKDRDVVIDGSNVAHNSQGNENSKPLYSNIILMVKFLKSKGFERVSVITDAALRHRIADPHLLPELKSLADYTEAPREKPADIFIINHVQKNHCLLISNDNFREWKMQNSWVAENIDFYRLTFMIKGTEVIMPDLS